MAHKRKTLALVVALAIAVIALPALAYANAGVHGGYTLSTDACAACHRAHTAPSQVTWTDNNTNTQSALLLGEYTTVQEFCLTCHGAAGQGADTNVEDGVYLARDTNATNYGTPGDPLISGPFGRPGGYDPVSNTYFGTDFWGKRVTSTHDRSGGTWGAWGGGIWGQGFNGIGAFTGSTVGTVGVGATQVAMDCDSCHDVHGTSNYRMLKDKVYGVTVGGYAGAVPDPYVRSVEPGFPAGGFVKGVNYIAAGYVPDYTKTNYARGYNDAAASVPDMDRGMSGWCVGCHTVYMGGENNAQFVRNRGSEASTYTAEMIYGTVERHRHPMNQPLSDFAGPAGMRPQVGASVDDPANIPLAHDFTSEQQVLAVVNKTNTTADWIECLSCHYAHGTTATMSGWAKVYDPKNDPVRNDPRANGVPPADSSTLLRFNDRYVCEACHQK